MRSCCANLAESLGEHPRLFFQLWHPALEQLGVEFFVTLQPVLQGLRGLVLDTRLLALRTTHENDDRAIAHSRDIVCQGKRGRQRNMSAVLPLHAVDFKLQITLQQRGRKLRVLAFRVNRPIVKHLENSFGVGNGRPYRETAVVRESVAHDCATGRDRAGGDEQIARILHREANPAEAVCTGAQEQTLGMHLNIIEVIELFRRRVAPHSPVFLQ